jgi:hypothetical protein
VNIVKAVQHAAAKLRAAAPAGGAR